MTEPPIKYEEQFQPLRGVTVKLSQTACLQLTPLYLAFKESDGHLYNITVLKMQAVGY